MSYVLCGVGCVDACRDHQIYVRTRREFRPRMNVPLLKTVTVCQRQTKLRQECVDTRNLHKTRLRCVGLRSQDKARAYILYQYQETAAKPIARMQNPSHLKNNETGHQTALALQE